MDDYQAVGTKAPRVLSQARKLPAMPLEQIQGTDHGGAGTANG